MNQKKYYENIQFKETVYLYIENDKVFYSTRDGFKRLIKHFPEEKELIEAVKNADKNYCQPPFLPLKGVCGLWKNINNPFKATCRFVFDSQSEETEEKE